MAHRVCPWWLGYFLASPLRRWLGQDPVSILSPYVREGMVVLEPGPGMGFFTIPLARLVGSSGRVIAVDVQAKMIAGLKRRAAKASVQDRIDARVIPAESLDLNGFKGNVDFALAFAVVHELPDLPRFFRNLSLALKPGATCLVAEPKGHVSDERFDCELAAAASVGLTTVSRPEISRSWAALLHKS